MTMTLADGNELPKATRRERHIYSFFKTSESRQVTVAVQETEHAGLLSLLVVEKTEGWEFLTFEYLTDIAALRVSQGWSILSASETAFIMVPAR